MKALLTITSKKGTGTIYTTENNGPANSDAKFVLVLLDKKINLTSLSGNVIILNPTKGPSYLVISAAQVQELFGVSMDGAKIEIISFADGVSIPKGETINVTNEAYLSKNTVNVDYLVSKITKQKAEIKMSPKKYTGKAVDSGCGFRMADTEKNWSLVSKYGFDAVEMVDSNYMDSTLKVRNEVNPIEIDS